MNPFSCFCIEKASTSHPILRSTPDFSPMAYVLLSLSAVGKDGVARRGSYCLRLHARPKLSRVHAYRRSRKIPPRLGQIYLQRDLDCSISARRRGDAKLKDIFSARSGRDGSVAAIFRRSNCLCCMVNSRAINISPWGVVYLTRDPLLYGMHGRKTGIFICFPLFIFCFLPPLAAAHP